MESADMALVLSARQYVYLVFQKLFGEEPSSRVLDAIDVSLLEDALSEVASFSGMATSAWGDLPNQVVELRKRGDQAKSMYCRLFVGPGKLQAPPWGSVYIGKERTLFQRSTLEVRDYYRSCGFLPKHYPSVADDHVAIELDFLAQLGQKAMEYHVSGEVEYCQNAIEKSMIFVERHLLPWLPRYVDGLERADEEGIFSSMSKSLLWFVESDVAILRNMTVTARISR